MLIDINILYKGQHTSVSCIVIHVQNADNPEIGEQHFLLYKKKPLMATLLGLSDNSRLIRLLVGKVMYSDGHLAVLVHNYGFCQLLATHKLANNLQRLMAS